MWPAALLTFVTCLILMPLTTSWLRARRVLDHPSHRSLHDVPMPRGGGAPIVAASLAGLAVLSPEWTPAMTALPVGVVLFASVGLLEDVRGVPPLTRLLLHAAATVAVTPLLVQDLSGSVVWRTAFVLGCILWLMAYPNAFNFMDGMNGISAAQVVVAGTAWALVAWTQDVEFVMQTSTIVVAGTLAFVPWNFPRARVFLGDVGSYALGMWLAVTLVIGLRAGIPPEAMIAPVGLYLMDTAATIVRRLAAGEKIHTPHRSHAYQRLVQLGWSHSSCTSFVATVMTLVSLMGAISLVGNVQTRLIAGLVAFGLLVFYQTLPTILGRRLSPISA